MKSMDQVSRPDRVAAQLQREIASILLNDVSDPALRKINVTQVKVTRDLSIARIYYLLIGTTEDERKVARARREAERGLERAMGWIRRELGLRLRLRLTPKLEFYWDDAVVHGRRMEDVFAELADEEQASDPEGEA